jgi:hypothetical protein
MLPMPVLGQASGTIKGWLTTVDQLINSNGFGTTLYSLGSGDWQFKFEYASKFYDLIVVFFLLLKGQFYEIMYSF